MSLREKLLVRLLQRPKDFTWNELASVLRGLRYRELKSSKTSGSRCRFVHERAPPILLHKPHPGNLVKRYALDSVIRILREGEMI